MEKNNNSPPLAPPTNSPIHLTTQPRPKTILETLVELNKDPKGKMASTASHSIPTVTSTATKNPIQFTKKELKYCSKWKKYINKIHNLIMDEIPNVCLVDKTNVSYRYESNDTKNKRTIMFECRYEGIPERQKCTGVIIENERTLFHMTKKTPKRLYKYLIDFIDSEYADTFITTSPYAKHTTPLVYSPKYLDTLKKKASKKSRSNDEDNWGYVHWYTGDEFDSDMDW